MSRVSATFSCLLLVLATSRSARAQTPWQPDLAGQLGNEDDALLDAPFEAPEATTTAPAPSFEEQLIELVNADRQDCANAAFYCIANAVSCGVSVCSSPRPPLKTAALLSVAAEGHSTAMGVRNFHMHCDPDTGSLPGNRAIAAGWPTSSVGENIAAGYQTPAAVMSTVNGWMADCGHCANVLTAGSREIGLGYYLDSAEVGPPGNVRQSPNGQCPVTSSANGPYFRYWTQDFSSRSGVYPLVIEREKYLVTTTSIALYVYQPPGSGLQMRFSNDGETWSAPVAFSTGSSWTLTAGDGVKSVYSEVTGSSGTFRACDRVWLDATGSVSDTIFVDSFECGGVDLWDLPIVTGG
jgi:uncharacterized protein YkwD